MRTRRQRRTLLTWSVVGIFTAFLLLIATHAISDSNAPPIPAAVKYIPPAVRRELLAGWGPRASFLGRYRVVVRGTGGPRAYAPTAGELTIFMRKVTGGLPTPQMSGILAVRTVDGGIELAYLTSLIRKDGVLHAKLSGGAFLGPVIGSFTGIKTAGGIAGVATIAGAGGFDAQYIRFSRSPEP